MSGLELLAVVGCVAAVVSAYNDGNELVRKYREKRRIKKARQELALQEGSTDNLEQSLVRGSSAVQSQYDHESRRWGNAFAEGDRAYSPSSYKHPDAPVFGLTYMQRSHVKSSKTSSSYSKAKSS